MKSSLEILMLFGSNCDVLKETKLTNQSTSGLLNDTVLTLRGLLEVKGNGEKWLI